MFKSCVSSSRFLLLALVSGLALTAAVPAVRAAEDNDNRITLLEENDSLYFNSDKHYTQGLRISNLGPELKPESGWNGPFNLFHDISPIFAQNPGDVTARRYSVFLGQSIFTPKDIVSRPPDPHDRPYGGWSYVGTSLLQETNQHMLENLELDLGVVGPAALGRQVQNDFHQLIGAQHAEGWSDQIQNEPGAELTYERMWKFPVFGDEDFGLDFVPQVGATLGNIFTYGEIGAQLRFGSGLRADYGPARIRPGLSGTDYFDSDAAHGNNGYYFFIGTQGRAVGRNVFLDGNSFRQSPSVQKKVLVGDLQAGFSFRWSTRLRLDFSVMERSKEFFGQRTPDEVGTAAMSFNW